MGMELAERRVRFMLWNYLSFYAKLKGKEPSDETIEQAVECALVQARGFLEEETK